MTTFNLNVHQSPHPVVFPTGMVEESPPPWPFGRFLSRAEESSPPWLLGVDADHFTGYVNGDAEFLETLHQSAADVRVDEANSDFAHLSISGNMHDRGQALFGLGTHDIDNAWHPFWAPNRSWTETRLGEGIQSISDYRAIWYSLLSTESFCPNEMESIKLDDRGYTKIGQSDNQRLSSRTVVSLILDAARFRATHWKEIVLRCSRLDSVCVLQLADKIAWGYLKALRKLDLSMNPNIMDRAMASLMAAFESNMAPDLKELYLAWTGFGQKSVLGLVKVIESRSLKNLETLDLSHNFRMAGKFLRSLFTSMRKKHGMPLRELILRNCGLNDEAVIQLAAALASGNLSCLNRLDLSGNFGLTDESMICVAASLAAGHVPHLTEFFWEWTALGDDGVHEFARAIRSGNLSRLEKLTLSRNSRISDASVITLAESFGSEQGLFLKEWSLSGTGVGDDGVAHLASLIISGNLISLETLDLSGCENVTSKCKEMFPDFFLRGKDTPLADLPWWLSEVERKTGEKDVMGSASKTWEHYASLLRCDVGNLGFTSWDQDYDSQRILLLCDQRKTTEQDAEFLFFHVQGMAACLGVGVPHSKVSVKRERFGCRVVIKELTKESWKGYWSELLSRTGFFKPILFKKEVNLVGPSASSSTTSSCTELHVTEGEALSKFGVCMDGTDGQRFTSVSGFQSKSPEDPSEFQRTYMQWFDDLIDHLQCSDASTCAQHNLESLVLSDSFDESKQSHATEEQPFLDGSDDQLPPCSLEQLQYGEEAIGHESCNSRSFGIPNYAYERSAPDSSRTVGYSPQSGDRGEIRGAQCRLEQERGGKRKHALQGNGSSGPKQLREGAHPTVRVKEELKDWHNKGLIIHVYFNPSNCKLYRLNSDTEEKEAMPSALPGVAPTLLPKSYIEPELVVGFLCESAQSDGLNQLSTTLRADYSIQSQKNDRPLGWSQDDLGLSFRCSKEENGQLCARMCDERILSPVKSKTLEFTRESGTTESTVTDKHFKGGFWSLEGGARAESTFTHSATDQSASKVELRCLSQHPTFAITATSKPRKLAYKAHSLIKPVARSDPLWRQMQGTGLYSTVRVAVEGTWNLLGTGLKNYEFKVSKKLSKRSEGVENAVRVPNVTDTLVTNGRGEGQSDKDLKLWQIMRKRFILNHNFSQFLEARKRSNPYRWILVDPSDTDGPVPEALKTPRE